MSTNSLIEEVIRIRDECKAASVDLIPASDPEGHARDAFKVIDIALTEVLDNQITLDKHTDKAEMSGSTRFEKINIRDDCKEMSEERERFRAIGNLCTPAGCPAGCGAGASVDPKRAAGSVKCQMHRLPPEFLRQTADVLDLGARKYGEYNWRKSGGVEANTYVGAILRHLTEYMDGVDADEDSGKSPLAHIAATCAVLIDAKAQDKLIDNRNKSKGFTWKASEEN